MQEPSEQLSYQQEVLRKLVHLSSLWVVVLYHFTDKDVMLNVLIPLTLVVLLVDGARRCSGERCPMLETMMGYLLRNRERKKLSGASYVMLSALIMVLFFPKLIAITAFTYLILADSAAALIGKPFGKHPFYGKSLEGCAAFFVTCLISMGVIAWIYDAGHFYIISATVAAFVATIVEVFSIQFKIDDNFSIPLSVGCVMVAAQYVLG